MGSDTSCGKCVICYVIFIFFFFGECVLTTSVLGSVLRFSDFLEIQKFFFLLGSYCDVFTGIRQYYCDFGRTPMKHLEFIFGNLYFFGWTSQTTGWLLFSYRGV